MLQAAMYKWYRVDKFQCSIVLNIANAANVARQEYISRPCHASLNLCSVNSLKDVDAGSALGRVRGAVGDLGAIQL
jgi:hypothetical protein